MLHETPLRKRHEEYIRQMSAGGPAPEVAAQRPGAAVGRGEALAEVPYVPYRPPGEERLIACELPATFGEVEAEYAAIRRGAGLLDSPHRGTLRLTGEERLDFLSRMVTQELKDLVPGGAREAFWLNRKGRIEADLLLIELGDELLVDVDICQAARAIQTLGEFIFSEDVQITDCSGDYHHIAVHGRTAQQVIATASGDDAFKLEPLAAKHAQINGLDAVIARRDQTGEAGLELIVPYDGAEAVWDALLSVDTRLGGGKRRVRPIGWYAYNIARIEAGTPLMNIDFGVTNLPRETGIIDRRISFAKGCFLGQEVVARIESRGRTRQRLVGLSMQGEELPIAGATVYEKAESGTGEPVGIVTSSTISPMLGARPVAFAMISAAAAQEGAAVLAGAEGELAEAIIGPLRFWPAPPDGSG